MIRDYGTSAGLTMRGTGKYKKILWISMIYRIILVFYLRRGNQLDGQTRKPQAFEGVDFLFISRSDRRCNFYRRSIFRRACLVLQKT